MCDEYCCNHGCNQGRNCPARTRRVKAGGPPPPDMPIQFAKGHENDEDDGFSAAAFVIGVSIGIIVLIYLAHDMGVL